MERIVPIYEDKPSKLKEGLNKKQARGTLADLLVCILSALTAVTALGYSILFFTRFLENDTHFWGVLSAFILCFGVGVFAYVPAALTSLIGWRAYKRGRIGRDLIWALVLILPWTLLSIVLVFVSDLSKLYSIPMLILTVLLTLWAVISYGRKS